MNGEKTLNLDYFEVVTAITQIYEDDIETYLLKKDGEVLQTEFAELVTNLYFEYIVINLFYEYMLNDTSQSLLSMINKKVIPLSQVIEN